MCPRYLCRECQRVSVPFQNVICAACYQAWLDEVGSPALAAAILADDSEPIMAHTSRVLTTTEAARAWDAATRPTTRTMIDLPADLEG
jgi:hypothetical protein